MEDKCHFESTLRAAMRMTGHTVTNVHNSIVLYSLVSAVFTDKKTCCMNKQFDINCLTQPGPLVSANQYTKLCFSENI